MKAVLKVGQAFFILVLKVRTIILNILSTVILQSFRLLSLKYSYILDKRLKKSECI